MLCYETCVVMHEMLFTLYKHTTVRIPSVQSCLVNGLYRLFSLTACYESFNNRSGAFFIYYTQKIAPQAL